MIEILAILLSWSIAYSIDTRIKVKDLETELHYGTYPSDMFPDDPRHKPDKNWWEYIFD